MAFQTIGDVLTKMFPLAPATDGRDAQAAARRLGWRLVAPSPDAPPHRYVYLGDKLTDPRLAGQPCDPIRRADGRVVVGSGKGVPRNQLVRFSTGELCVVSARRLRLAGGGL